MPIKVFISYSHDSPEHSERVLQFATALHSHGINVELDRYHTRPPKGWPHWCEEQLRPENSQFVLMICTETYLRRVQDQVPADEGRGVFWEGAIIHNYIYDAKGNQRFVPVLFPGTTDQRIPVPIRNHTHYSVNSFDLDDPGYSSLYRELTGQPFVTKPAVGQLVALSSHQPPPPPARAVQSNFPDATTDFQISPTRLPHGAEKLFGREGDLKRLDDAWNNPATHILTIVAWGGVGKTSLVVEWMNRQAAAGWPGFDRVFDWSFYSQGTRDHTTASADTFIAEALKFFGDEPMSTSPASPWDKGARLANLVAKQRNLLVIDGIESLQFGPGPSQGKLKDPILEILFKSLARNNPGLCVVTTRESVIDLEAFHQTTAPEWKLLQLPAPAAIEFLKSLGVNGTEAEFQNLVEDADGHALTLNLLGRYLALAHNGDIRKRDLVKLHEADDEVMKRHAFHVVEAYEHWFASGGEKGRRQLAILYIMGLFDRPAEQHCLVSLRKQPAIPNLTEPLAGLSDAEWNVSISRLEKSGLLNVRKNQFGEIRGLDAHPLVREHFAQRLQREQPKAWQKAHARLYRHLNDTTSDKPRPTLEDLQPIFQAVAHGCHAGMQQEACDKTYRDRILRGTDNTYGFYSTKTLGAFGSDLGAVACFFVQPWQRLAPSLSEDKKSWLLNQAAYDLRALGRLNEALDTVQVALEMVVVQKNWAGAASGANNLSEMEMTVGNLPSALRNAERSVMFADQGGNSFQSMGLRTTVADALHQSGQREVALARFREAENMQAERQPKNPMLISFWGFRYCDLLLAPAERSAWEKCLHVQSPIPQKHSLDTCPLVFQRAANALATVLNGSRNPLDIALNNLTLARVALYTTILEKTALTASHSALETAVTGLRFAGYQDHIPRGLLTRAWLRFLENNPAAAQADLDEAWEIAERGPMRLYMADIHLHRARLFFREKTYPWQSPAADLAAAEKLIDSCGYHRRDQELADAKKAMLS